MTRRAAVIVVALVAAALVGVGLLAIPGSPLEQRPTLGLDLQGGLEVTLQAVPPRDRELTKEDLDRSVSIMRDRVDKLGVAEPEIRTQGDDQISIQLPGVKDPAAAAAIIGKTAQLELFDLQANLVAPSIDVRTRQPIATPKLYDLLARPAVARREGQARHVLRLRDEGQEARPGPGELEGGGAREVGRQAAARAQAVRGAARAPSSCGCGIGEAICPGVARGRARASDYWYLFRYTPPEVPEMTGEDLDLSGTRQDFDTRTGEPIVLMDFTDKGAEKFEDITREIAQRGKLLFNTVGGGQGDHQQLAAELRDRARPRDQVVAHDRLRGVPGRHLRLERRADLRASRTSARRRTSRSSSRRARSRSSSAPLDQTAISATLGKDSLQEAKTAALVGLLAVAIFLLVFYRFLGVVAVVGLVVYAAILYAAILLFNVTLTLPGIAGLVLTLGVAADANIVIFERIKEEVRAGRSVRAAIQTGYTKGFATIVDANVVTMITALVLFAVATASVRGFALMLLVGTAISMLTAVVATRAFLAVPRRPQAARQPAADGRSRRRDPALAEARLHRPPEHVVRDLRRRRGHRARRDRRQGPQPRHRLQGRHPDRVRDAARRSRSRRCARRRRGSARRAPRSRVAGRSPSGDSYRSFRSAPSR